MAAPEASLDRVAGIILAAGASARFGPPKQLARFGTRTLLEAVIDVAIAGGLDPVIVVVPSGMAVPPRVVPVLNAEPERGLSRSLRLGLGAVPVEASAVVVMLGDQPTVEPAHIHRLLAARGDRPVVAGSTGDIVAPPVLLERAVFDLADEAAGDAGLRDLLRRSPDLVTPIEVEEHAPDVDAPSDLERLLEPCPGCGARLVPDPDGATHPYIGASPACWAAFGELMAREFSDRRYGRMHRHTVDVYTVQHPGSDGRRERQSVALHLIALCHWLEHDMTPDQLHPITQRLAEARPDWPWLEPPTSYELTVLDVLDARDPEEHAALIRRWAETTWSAWSPHGARVRRWAAEALD